MMFGKKNNLVYFLHQKNLPMNTNDLKKLSAEEAVKQIQNGMIVGLGSGSTVQFALQSISQRIKDGLLQNIAGVPTSQHTEKVSKELGIPIISLNEAVSRSKEPLCIDLTIDGADEVDENLNLIKGGGGAHLREKIIAQATKKLIIIVDETKISKCLGEKWAVPIEVIQSAFLTEKFFLESIGAKTIQRKASSGEDYLTDEGNFIIDANFGKIENAEKLASCLNQRAGIVEHGLFLGMTSKVICATKGGVKIIDVNNIDKKFFA
jgi:ribose 5-phosphate isomerase A